MKSKFLKTSFKWGETFDALIEINYLAIIFLIPLFFSILFPTFNIFEFNKLALFKSLTWLLLLFSGLKIIFYSRRPSSENKENGNISNTFKKYYLIPLIFIIGLSITLFFSIDSYLSFFGSYDRQQGLLSYWFYFLWFILILFNLKSQSKVEFNKKINKIAVVSVVSGFVVALYGVLQILNIDFLTWSESPFIFHRATSTLGQPNFLASYLLLIIPLSFYLFIKSSNNLIKFLYFLILLIQVYCLFVTASRGALLSLGLIAAGIFLFSWLKTRLHIYKKILVIIIFLVVMITGAFSLERIYPGRISSVFNLQYGSSAVRVIFYKVAILAISEKPIFGYGLENSSEIFIKYYQPDWGIYGDVGATTDRAHNLILDILLSGGVFALVIFSLLYYQFYLLAIKNIKKEGLNSISLFLLLGVAGYLFSLLFSFTIVTGEIYFWLYLAMLSAVSMSGNLPDNKIQNIIIGESKSKLKKLNIFFKFILSLLLIFIVYFGISFEERNLSADYYFNKLYYTLAQKKYFDTLILNDYLSAEKTNIVNQTAYNQFLAGKLSEFYPSIYELSPKFIVRDELEKLDKSLGQNGYKNLLAHAEIRGALGDINKSLEYFSELEKNSPRWPAVSSLKGQALFINKKYPESISAYQSALSNLPSANDPRLKNNNELHDANVLNFYYFYNREIGNGYFALGDYAQAETYYQRAYQYNLKDFTLLKKIADTYYLRSNLAEAIKYNEYGYKRSPKDYHWPSALAVLYFENKNRIKALQYLDEAIKLAPDNEDLKNLKLEYSR